MAEYIDKKTIEKARSAAQSRTAAVFRDSDVAGLCIQVKNGSAHWWVMTKNNKISFSPLDGFRIDQMPLVREIAAKIKASWKAGRKNDDIKIMVAALLSQPTATPSVEAAENVAAVKIDGAWTWEILRNEYLAWAKIYKSDAMYSTYRSALGAAKNSRLASDFAHIAGRPIANITQLDILTVRQNILERGGMVNGIPKDNVRAAEQTENGLKAAFKFAMDPRRVTGLKMNPTIGLPAVDQPDLKKRDVVNADDIFDRPFMSLKQIYDFLFWVDEQDFAHEAKRAVTLQALTGQRIETVTTTFHNQMARTYNTSGRFDYVWYLGPDKNKRYRPLPLPSWAAWAGHSALMRYRERSPAKDANNFLFPQLKKRYAHIPGNGHISNKLVNDIFQAARKPGGPLEGTHFASHDLRRAFVTHMGKKGRKLGFPYDDIVSEVAKVTHKGEGKISVIQRFYDLDTDSSLKLRMLELWQNMILGAHGEAKRPDDRWFELDEPEVPLTREEWLRIQEQTESDFQKYGVFGEHAMFD